MKGLELARQYYLTYGQRMIAEQFPQYESVIAVGLVGAGSECYGYDDDISTDHDFEPGFCMFIPDKTQIDDRTAFTLERAYRSLPNEFLGFRRQELAPVGGNRHGVIRIDDFYRDKIGASHFPLSDKAWFHIPEYALAEATNGAVFRDDLGLFSAIRRQLLTMPEDVRKKKLAGNLLLMAQAGQYNYARCLQHNETGAAQLAIHEFVLACTQCIFLLNEKFAPFYKWKFRAMRDLPILSNLAQPLEFLISSDNSQNMTQQKLQWIEKIANDVTSAVKNKKLSHQHTLNLETLAYSVNDTITDASLRNEHILYAI